MSDLLVKPTDVDASGRSIHVTPESAGWTYIGFDVHKLESGQDLKVTDTDREICIVLLSGSSTFSFLIRKSSALASERQFSMTLQLAASICLQGMKLLSKPTVMRR